MNGGGGDDLLGGLLCVAAGLLCLAVAAVIGVVALGAGFFCAAMGYVAVRSGRRLAGGVWASGAVLHGAAWQACVAASLIENPPGAGGWGGAAVGLVALGGFEALGLLGGVAVLVWIARGGGLAGAETGGPDPDDGGG